MTDLQFAKLKKWQVEGRNILSGYFTLFPTAIQYIAKPSEYIKEEARKQRSLHVGMISAKIEKHEFVIFTRFMGKIKVPYRYVQHARIYNYNY